MFTLPSVARSAEEKLDGGFRWSLWAPPLRIGVEEECSVAGQLAEGMRTASSEWLQLPA